MNSENINAIKNIATKNPSLFFKILSENYPFSFQMLIKFGDKLDWELLSCNPNIEWSDELIEMFDFKWNWDKLIKNKNIKRSILILEKYALFQHFGYTGDFELTS